MFFLISQKPLRVIQVLMVYASTDASMTLIHDPNTTISKEKVCFKIFLQF